MAHVYSAKAPHLSSVKSIPYKPGLPSLFILAIASALIVQFIIKHLAPPLSETARFILYIALFAVIFIFLRWLYAYYRKYNSHKFPFVKLGERENSVLGQLSALPEAFSVFHRIELPDHKPIHFVVVSPAGIFAIRVKHLDGVIGFDGTELTHNGHELEEGDLVYQTIKQEKALERFLCAKLGEEISVKPLLVFSADTIVTQLSFWEMRGICITRLDHLDDYLVGHSNMEYRTDTSRVSQALHALLVR
jgi:hypothetical protein